VASRSETTIVLAGGLGNQLFQIAAALYVSKGNSILIDVHSANPRFQKNNMPELDFVASEMPVRYSKPSDSNWLIRKIIGFSIRQSGKNLHIFLHKALELIASFGFSIAALQIRRIWINRGIGFDPRIELARPGSVLVGYFQTHVWVSKPGTLDQIHQLIKASLPTSFKNVSQNEVFKIAVHVRLGDYLSENSFGIPNQTYYRDSLKFIFKSQSNAVVNLYSDEPHKALNWIPPELHKNLEVFDDRGLSSLETLVSMSNSQSLIIANSTFSWWAATLSHANGAYIVAPKPWFAHADSPIRIIPEAWSTFQADYPARTNIKA
jgi:hypothetical protein